MKWAGCGIPLGVAGLICHDTNGFHFFLPRTTDPSACALPRIWQNQSDDAPQLLRYATVLAALHLRGQNRPETSSARPDTFRVYTDGPRLLLRPQRLRLLKRERARRSLRWDQFETLWTASAPFPELPWVQALRFQVADDKDAGTRAVAWAVGPADATQAGRASPDGDCGRLV